MRIISLLLFFVISSSVFSQKKYPENYFDKPLKIPIVLSGTFGELRSNHFHSGIDIKTQGKEGIPIYAPADGYIARIKVGQYGYGKALYMNHPNGYTTVYAHLSKFSLDIQKYVKSVQYKKQRYAIGNLFPKPTRFTFKKGDVIGYTGDSGSSGGPHLHYEFRDTKTEHIINPFHFGLQVDDSIKPIIRKLIVYPLNEYSRINNVQHKTTLSFKKLSKGNYIADNIYASGTIGFAVGVFDQLDGAKNKNGIYSLEMRVNGKRHYYHDVETFSFSESKYINLLIDYEYYGRYKSRVQKTYKHPSSKLRIYGDLIEKGKITVADGLNYNVEIIAKDFKGNTSMIKVPVTGVKSSTIFKQKDTTNVKIVANQFNKYTKENISVAFAKKSFYEDCYLDVNVSNDTIDLHKPVIPLDKKFTLTFNTNHLTPSQKQKVYIANVTKKYSYYVTTKRGKNKVYTNQKSLGSYTLKFDKSKPKISLVNFKNNQKISNNRRYLKVRIKDTFSGIRSWRATIDGKWILMEFNHKRKILSYDLMDTKLGKGKHVFKIRVVDNVGNTKSYTANFLI